MIKVIHAFIEAGVSGGLHNGAGQIIGVEDFKGPGVPKKDPEARIRYNVSLSSSGRA